MQRLFAFMFDDLFFPTGQQEYGVLEVASWLRGTPSAEPSLLTPPIAWTAGPRNRSN